jgi:hypothetical protein
MGDRSPWFSSSTEPVSCVIAVEQNRTNLFEVGGLASKRICTRKPLNLDCLLINKVLENSLVPAQIKIVDRVSDQMDAEDTLCGPFRLVSLFLTNSQKHSLNDLLNCTKPTTTLIMV